MVVEMGYIKGVYRKSIFTSDKGYTIGLFKVIESDIEIMQEHINKIITFTGYFYNLNTEDVYIMEGEVANHPRYGFQFNASSYEKVKPSDREGVITFLSSSLFPGIGEKLAKAITDTLGDKALDEILKDKNCLNLVPKITLKKMDIIYNNLVKYSGSHESLIKLTNLGFNMKEAISIYNEYKENTLKILEDNIYTFTNVKDIPFLKIDQIAKSLDYQKNDIRRVKPTILYVMQELCFNHGDVYLEENKIKAVTDKYLEVEIENYDTIFDELINDDEIVVEGGKYYLKDLYEAEVNVANTLYELATKESVQNNKIDEMLEYLEKENNIIYNEEQKNAITKALNSNFLIITGGPGTGKTTIIKAICRLYQMMGNYSDDDFINRLALLAPTGRASKRMSEGANLPASTIHRFLKWNKDTNEFLVNENNKALNKLIIIDEASMIDISLFDSLLKGLTKNIKLILVGDYNKLTSF